VVDALAEGSSFVMASGESVPLFSDAATACGASKADVVIDFTNAAWTPVLTSAAVPRGVRPVIGTSGLSEAYIDELARACAAQKLGGVYAANFAIGAVLMMHMARVAAPFFDAAEIIELHHDQKVDAPSGTSIATARGMSAARGGKPFARNEPELETIANARAASVDGVTIHSVRLKGLVAHQEVVFGGTGQTLTIRHDSNGRDSFMPGILLAVREVMRRDRLVVGLEELVGLEG
jgi:4-hydroxy-tetrahydrodipicolinate reductase